MAARAMHTTTWAAGFLLGASAAAASAQTAPASTHLCVDRNGVTYTLAQRPDPGYSFFVRCHEEASAAAPRDSAAERARQFEQWRKSQSVLVSWPSLREPWPVVVRVGANVGPAGSAGSASPTRALAYLPIIERVAESHDLDPHYLKAMMHTESAFRADAISPKGAVGLMQLMPATAQRFGVADRQRLHDPEVNVETAARYIGYLRRLFDDDWTLITAAYNAGEGAVRRYGNKVPPFPETQNYVRQVDARLVHYSGSGWQAAAARP
jgi:soluble lytic murein transglycosylase-like protein